MTMLQNLREIMELSVAQVADELNVPRQDVIDAEETGNSYLLPAFIAAFPINPAILQHEDADPFLDSFDQTSPGHRMKIWREENGISAAAMAKAMGMAEGELRDFEEGGPHPMTRRHGERIEKQTGINRKWLMYGDGREKGTPVFERAKSDAPAPGEAPARKTAPNREAGLQVREARQDAGMTREELAEMLRLSVSRVAQMESGYIRDDKAAEILRKIEARERAGGGMTPGQRIRSVRKAAGMTLKAAAEAIGIAPGTIAAMESGRVSEKRAEEIISRLKDAAPAKAAPAQETGPERNVAAGSRIREERREAGLSQKALATILRVPVPRISEIEVGNVTDAEAERIIARIHGAPRREAHAKRVKSSNKALLGWQIRDARKTAGLSQNEVGSLIGVSQGRISLIERGQVEEETAAEILRLIEETVRAREESAGETQTGPAED